MTEHAQIDSKDIFRTRGTYRFGVNADTGNIFMTFLSEDGRSEHPVEIPRDNAAATVIGLMSAAKLANEALEQEAQRMPNVERALVSALNDVTSFQVSAVAETDQVALVFQTAVGLTFRFLIPAQDVPQLRVGIRRAEELLNQARRPTRQKH